MFNREGGRGISPCRGMMYSTRAIGPLITVKNSYFYSDNSLQLSTVPFDMRRFRPFLVSRHATLDRDPNSNLWSTTFDLSPY